MAKSLVLDQGLGPLAGYTLVRLLGRGGFGEVWEARAPGDFHVALKFLRLEMRESAVEQRALQVIRNIRHVHLLDVQFATRVADCLVIAMPLCDHSLKDRLNACRAEGRPGVPRNELLRYMDELSRAVDYLNEPRHQAEDGSLVGVQHRDIKPDNIFLVGGSVRLADFGLAKILSATVASTRGTMTPSYAAPEVIQGRFSRWSDKYSRSFPSPCETSVREPGSRRRNRRSDQTPFRRSSSRPCCRARPGCYPHHHRPRPISRPPRCGCRTGATGRRRRSRHRQNGWRRPPCGRQGSGVRSHRLSHPCGDVQPTFWLWSVSSA
jgi:serine/threonine protein kinase